MLRLLAEKIEKLGHLVSFTGEVCLAAARPPFRPGLLVAELEALGINSIVVIVLAGLSIGMIIALQMVSLLIPFNAEIGTGAAVAVAMARELAPIITTLMLIAKNGSAMAAELGTMRVTEQIDALDAMSVDPVQFLVVPRVIASVLVFPALTMLANIVGVIGAYFISTSLYSIDRASYVSYMFNVLMPADITIGLLKSAVMGFMVAVTCCYYGLNAEKGAKGVGDGATRAVVASSVSILIADYILTSIMMSVGML